MVVRRVYGAWSIEIPASFAETFIDGDNYWHAYDATRSVSLTSIVLTDGDQPVEASRILREIQPELGTPIDEIPAGLAGWAFTSDAPPGARASRLLSGMVAIDGRMLLTTVTSDDLEWARRIWLSISEHPVAIGPEGKPDLFTPI